MTSGVTAFIEYSLNGASWFVSEGFSDKEERPAIYAHFKLGNCCMVSLNDFDVSSLLGLAIRILMSNISLNMYIYLGVPRKSWGGVEQQLASHTKAGCVGPSSSWSDYGGMDLGGEIHETISLHDGVAARVKMGNVRC